MGVKKFLKFVKGIYGIDLDMKKHVKGKSVGVDMMALLHGLCGTYKRQLILAGNFKLITTKIFMYLLPLISYGSFVKLYFDGNHFPGKEIEYQKRDPELKNEEKKTDPIAKFTSYLNLRLPTQSETKANEKLITGLAQYLSSDLVAHVYEALMNTDWFRDDKLFLQVCPYEADHQMTKDRLDVIVVNDSDYVVHGNQAIICDYYITSKNTFKGVYIAQAEVRKMLVDYTSFNRTQQADYTASIAKKMWKEVTATRVDTFLKLLQFCEAKDIPFRSLFVRCAVAIGCDYSNVSGIGLLTMLDALAKLLVTAAGQSQLLVILSPYESIGCDGIKGFADLLRKNGARNSLDTIKSQTWKGYICYEFGVVRVGRASWQYLHESEVELTPEELAWVGSTSLYGSNDEMYVEHALPRGNWLKYNRYSESRDRQLRQIVALWQPRLSGEDSDRYILSHTSQLSAMKLELVIRMWTVPRSREDIKQVYEDMRALEAQADYGGPRIMYELKDVKVQDYDHEQDTSDDSDQNTTTKKKKKNNFIPIEGYPFPPDTAEWTTLDEKSEPPSL